MHSKVFAITQNMQGGQEGWQHSDPDHAINRWKTVVLAEQGV